MSRKINYTSFTPDSVVDSILNKFVDRAELGFKKYNNTLDRNDLTPIQWVEHALEEHMDAILYLTKLKQDLINAQENPGHSQTSTEA
jgi:hypothetical protein